MGISRDAYLEVLNRANKPSKYHNKPTIVDGIRFASMGEANRYKTLKILEQRGDITDLKLQPVFKFQMRFSYRADFEYIFQGRKIVEDFKGMETDVFKLKKKCFEYFYPNIELKIIKK